MRLREDKMEGEGGVERSRYWPLPGRTVNPEDTHIPRRLEAYYHVLTAACAILGELVV